jgi:hypothetical protein
VEYRAVIALSAQDMQKAALHGVEFIKDNPRLLYVRAVHERNSRMTDAITFYPVTIAQVAWKEAGMESGPFEKSSIAGRTTDQAP